MGRKIKEPNKKIYNLLRSYNTSAEDITIKTYCCNLEKIFRDLGDEDFNIETLKDTEKVFEVLDKLDFTENTYKNKLSSIITYLLANGVDKSIIDIYAKKVEKFKDKINEEKDKMQWTEKEAKNKMTLAEIKEYIKEKYDQLPFRIEKYVDIYKYQQYLSAAFQIEYPLRNELCDMKIYYYTEYEKINKDKDINYMVISPRTMNMKIILNKYKTKKTYGEKEFDVENKELIALFLKYYKALKVFFEDKEFNHWLLFKPDYQKLTRNDYTKFLQRVFENTNKTISTSLIRKIVLSEVYPLEKIKKLSHIMGHSIVEGLKTYTKN